MIFKIKILIGLEYFSCIEIFSKKTNGKGKVNEGESSLRRREGGE